MIIYTDSFLIKPDGSTKVTNIKHRQFIYGGSTQAGQAIVIDANDWRDKGIISLSISRRQNNIGVDQYAYVWVNIAGGYLNLTPSATATASAFVIDVLYTD